MNKCTFATLFFLVAAWSIPAAGSVNPGALPPGACDTIPPPDPYEGVLLQNISLNGGGNTLTITANDSFTLSLSYYIQECANLGWFKQVVVGYTASQPAKCFYGSNPDCLGESGLAFVKLKAPNFPGFYTIGFDVAQDSVPLICPGTWPGGTPPATRYLACLNVLEGDLPITVTGVATNVTSSAATLGGTVNPNGATTTVAFLHGTSPGVYPDTITAAQSPLTGVDPVPVSASVSGLTANTWYYYRVFAENVNGYNLGAEGSYFTGPAFQLAEAIHDFGYVPLNGEKTDSVEIINPGYLSLTVSSVIPLNGQFLVSPSGGTIPPGGSKKFAVTFAPLAYGTVSSGLVFVHGGPTNPDTQLVRGHVPIGSVAEGWNIVSIPLDVPDRSKSAVFPGATSSAFGFSSGYSTADTLEFGNGYWLKYGAPETLVIAGGVRIADTVTVMQGWNLIGCPTLPVPLDSISSDPPGLIQGSIFGYQSGYAAVTALQPARGYWVKVVGNGTLTLRSDLTAAFPANPAVSALRTGGYGLLRISDAKGFTQELFVGHRSGPPVEIPPPPPAGVPDVRFEGGYLAVDSRALPPGGRDILIRDAVAPLSVSWDGMPAGLNLDADGAVLPMGGEGRVVVRDVSTLRLTVGEPAGGPADAPRAFALEQNYPNPFNPSTVVRFEIGEEGPVDLGVFNPLGERVATLVDRVLPGGRYSREFDARGLPAGVYFARLRAGGETVSVKMLLVK